MRIAEKEWTLWREMCTKLKASGAVTVEDLAALKGAAGTPGGRLINAIREWGDALVSLRRHSDG